MGHLRLLSARSGHPAGSNGPQQCSALLGVTTADRHKRLYWARIIANTEFAADAHTWVGTPLHRRIGSPQLHPSSSSSHGVTSPKWQSLHTSCFASSLFKIQRNSLLETSLRFIWSISWNDMRLTPNYSSCAKVEDNIGSGRYGANVCHGSLTACLIRLHRHCKSENPTATVAMSTQRRKSVIVPCATSKSSGLCAR